MTALTPDDEPAEGDEPGRGAMPEWQTFTLPVESDEVAAHQLLQLGTHAEVIAPASLRRTMADVGRAIAERHRNGGR